VRASTIYQKPSCARNNSGTFVIAIAVGITITGGMQVRESDSCEANHPHVGVGVPQNALCKEDQPHRNTNQEHAARPVSVADEKLRDAVIKKSSNAARSPAYGDDPLATAFSRMVNGGTCSGFT
jgi:hypothetical protein